MDFFPILPSEIMFDILLRLDVVDIMRCKTVCKPWLRLVRTDHFVRSHLSRSVPGLFVRVSRESEPSCCEILEFEERNENQNSMAGDPCSTGYFEFHFNSVMRFNIPLLEDTKLDIHSSANGLLFLVKTETKRYRYETNYICNPITREYINISSCFACHRAESVGYRFGVNKLGQHTVLRVRQRNGREKYVHFDVYTVGSGSWRSVASPDPSLCGDIPFDFAKYIKDGPCLDGKFHWLNLCRKSPNILCFDLETELFSICDLPLQFKNGKTTLSALGDSLCLWDSTCGDEIVWLPDKRGGMDKSWVMEFAIPKNQNLRCNSHSSNFLFKAPLSVVKAFKNRNLLMKDKIELFLSQPHSRTVHGLIHGLDWWRHQIRYSPSFLPLSSFNMENALSF